MVTLSASRRQTVIYCVSILFHVSSLVDDEDRTHQSDELPKSDLNKTIQEVVIHLPRVVAELPPPCFKPPRSGPPSEIRGSNTMQGQHGQSFPAGVCEKEVIGAIYRMSGLGAVLTGVEVWT